MVYLDETWVNAHHGHNTMWVDADGEAGWKHPSKVLRILLNSLI